jgi:hypothetical protein
VQYLLYSALFQNSTVAWPVQLSLPYVKKNYFIQAFKWPHQSMKVTQWSLWGTWWSPCPGTWRTLSGGRGTPPSTTRGAVHPMNAFQGRNHLIKKTV